MPRQSKTPPRRKDRKKRSDLLGTIIMMGCAVVVIAIGGAYFWYESQQTELDETFCPTSGPVSVTAVLIDRTDTLNAVQQDDVRQRLNGLRDSVPIHGLLAVYSVDSTEEGLLKPEFRLCNPGRGEELSKWVANPRLAQMRWEELFGHPLQEVFDSMVEGGSADSSPILESIQSVALSVFTGEKVKNAHKELIVVSDMLQHTVELSHYRGENNFGRLRASNYYRRIHTNLDGAKVSILYIRRPTAKAAQSKEHVLFWKEYFLDQNAVPSFVRIQG